MTHARFSQSMGVASADGVRVRGHDLTTELMGRVGFGEMVFLEVSGRRPEPAELELFDAVLVALVEHGMMATNLAARLTYVGAPEALQASVAAGLCGAGSVFLGAIDEAARILQEAVASGEPAESVVARHRAQQSRLPGFGHPVHRGGDPRTARLYELAARSGTAGPHMALARELEAAAAEAFGRPLPLNADGACGAVISDLGFNWRIARGFAVIARCAGLVGHLYEEIRQPTARELWRHVEELFDYEDPR